MEKESFRFLGPTQVCGMDLARVVLGIIRVCIERNSLPTLYRGKGNGFSFKVYIKRPSIISNGCKVFRYGTGDRL
jgi:hypothetical protein